MDSAWRCSLLALASTPEDLWRAGWQEGGREGRQVSEGGQQHISQARKPHDGARKFYTQYVIQRLGHNFKMDVTDSFLQIRKES